MITIAEAVDDTAGGRVVDDLGAVVEVVKVVATIVSPETKDVIQLQVLHETQASSDPQLDNQTSSRQT